MRRALARGLLVLGASFALLGASATALAEPTAAEKETARSLMAQGRARRAAFDYKGALEAFKLAHEIMKVPSTGLEVGRSLAEVGQLTEALDMLLSIARSPKKSGEPWQFGQARAEAAELADSLVIRIPSLSLKLSNIPPGDPPIKIWIDGTEMASSVVLGAPIKLNPGAHKIVVRVGAAERKANVNLVESKTTELTIDMAGTAPVGPADDAPKPKEAPPPTVVTQTSTLTYVGFGLAGAGVLVGGIAGLVTLSKASSVKEQCTDLRCPTRAHDDLSTAHTMANVSNIGFAVAGVGVGLGIIGLLTPTKIEVTSTSGRVWLRPMVGLGSVVVTGEF